jgi:hypothetical protein
MRRFVSGFCCLVVGLQVLIGVPVAVCLAFFVCLGSDVLGPLSVEVRATRNTEPPALLPAVAPPETSARGDAILSAREERGSLLAGTTLGANLTPADEQREFVAAFRQVAEEHNGMLPAPANPLPPPSTVEDASSATKGDVQRAETDRFVVQHLYAMAEQDEQARLFDRADQWRGHARAIRGDSQPQSAAVSDACADCLRTAEAP